ncbi:MAG: zinc ribbon domain-containing protein [Phycisphaerales bacterium]|nr:zinc ribbon domain-containing protein [Phycisphaerales bacterium]
MPTYDYRCRACDHRFELTQSMTAPVKRKCPECGKLQLERLIGIGAGFIIKGGGHSARAEAAEIAKSEKDSETAKASPKDSQDSAKTSSTSSTTTTPDATAPKKKSETEKQPQPEKKLSGSTSTPTHAAREGRGVGNLVDKAKRRAKEASTSKTRKKKKQ